MERDYKYVVLGGAHSSQTSGGGSRRLLWCLLVAMMLLVVISLGVYFFYYARHLALDVESLNKQKVLLISIDAFRYNLHEKAPTANFDFIIKNGASVDYMANVFPTVTLTNHQSIVTGLYAENHGMVANGMYIRETNEIIWYSNTEARFWNDSTPIWAENELQGHKSGVCYWPGYDVLFGGKLATYIPHGNYTSPLKSSDNLMPYEMRIDLVTDWLKKPDVNFAALYFGSLDELMHHLGADPVDKAKQQQLQAAITEMDKLIGKVLSNLKEGNLTEEVNIIIVGDHGMSNQNTSRVINLQRYVNNITNVSYYHRNGHIYAKPGQTQTIYKKLKEAERREGHLKVYLKKDIPKRYRVRNHPRTGDILYVVDEGWSTSFHYDKLNRSLMHLGTHGYSTDVENMRPAFFAYGPSFRRGYKQHVVNMVDLYELMCHILKITPKANDGSFENVKSLLQG